MQRTGGRDLHFGLDAVTIGSDRAFGFGWVFHDSFETASIRLEVGDGSAAPPASIEAAIWKARPDVALSFPGHRHSLHSGFYFYGGWAPSGRRPEKASLRVVFGNGESYVHAIEVNESSQPPTLAARGGALLRHLRRSLAYARSGDFRGLFRRASRYLDDASLPHSSPAALDGIVRALARPPLLLVDHDLGGGANRYREELVRRELAAGAAVLLLTYDVRRFEYRLELRSAAKKARACAPSLDSIRDLIAGWPLSAIFYNDCVSFREPAGIPVWLAGLRRRTGAVLRVAIHDFLPVCPSQHLVDAGGKFCGIPELRECRTCLAAHRDGFVSLFASRDIDAWRRDWLELLGGADEILCFSESSRLLLLRAYPGLPCEKMAIVPHQIGAAVNARPVMPAKKPLHIGVVGNITVHKGALVVRDLAREIARRGLATKIAVIGSIDIAALPDCLSETGAYEPQQLPGLIESSGANVFLFPSICPETFSYVTEELIRLAAPLVCFRWGAPAERVGRYDRGRVLDYSGSRKLLDDLLEFHDRLASRPAVQPGGDPRL